MCLVCCSLNSKMKVDKERNPGVNTEHDFLAHACIYLGVCIALL
jgi:hypothetical protein